MRRSKLDIRGGGLVQPLSTMPMEKMMMKMVAVICWSDLIKLDKFNVVGILHIMLIMIVYRSIMCHTYKLYQ